MKLTFIRFTLSSNTADELELNDVGVKKPEDDCNFLNISHNQTVTSIDLYHDQVVQGVAITMSDVTRHEMGILSGTNRTLYFTEDEQPVGLYGVTSDQGLIKGLGFIKFVCVPEPIALEEVSVANETAANEQVDLIAEVDIANNTVNNTIS